MERRYKPPRYPYELKRLGRSTISKTFTMHVPTQIQKNFNLKGGDHIEFYPPDTDFPDEEIGNILAILIIHKGGEERGKDE